MIVAIIVATLFGFTALQSGQNVARGTPPQQHADEVAGLLKQIGLPESPTTKRVRAQLVLMANQSPNSRKTVVEALIRVLNDPRDEFDFSGVYQWRYAVALLGELNATEAIEDLVRNISWTSYLGSPHPPYPVKTALVRIGEPAVPRLLSALADANWSVRREASEALGEIGNGSIDGLLDVLARAGPHARAGAADALARIGNAKAREAIEIALRMETDKETKKRLENAVGYMDHVECTKDSRKCK